METENQIRCKNLYDLATDAGYPAASMIELAGFHLARLAHRQWKLPATVTVLVGGGHNGATGLAAARHLLHWGHRVHIVCPDEEGRWKPASQEQLALVKIHPRVKVSFLRPSVRLRLPSAQVIDALIGWHLSGDPRTGYAKLIDVTNREAKSVLSSDIPSGLDPVNGISSTPTIRADTTLCFGMIPPAFSKRKTRCISGKRYLADLGIPDAIYQAAAIAHDPRRFQSSSLINVS